MFETSGGVREQRVIAGEGMVRPMSPMIVSYEGQELRLIPGRHRLDPESPIVRDQPEKFELCLDDDRSDAPYRFQGVLRTADRAIEKELARARARCGEDASWRL